MAEQADHEGALEESELQAQLAEKNAIEMASELEAIRETVALGVEASLAKRASLTIAQLFSMKQAVDDSECQASFAEQTAREMKQVLDWWQGPHTPKPQRDCLAHNTLVEETPKTTLQQTTLFRSQHQTNIGLNTQDDEEEDATVLDSLKDLWGLSQLSSYVPALMLDSIGSEALDQSTSIDSICRQTSDMSEEVIKLDAKAEPEAPFSAPSTKVVLSRRQQRVFNLWAFMRRIQLGVGLFLWDHFVPIDVRLLWVWCEQNCPVQATYAVRLLAILAGCLVAWTVREQRRIDLNQHLVRVDGFSNEPFWVSEAHYGRDTATTTTVLYETSEHTMGLERVRL